MLIANKIFANYISNIFLDLHIIAWCASDKDMVMATVIIQMANDHAAADPSQMWSQVRKKFKGTSQALTPKCLPWILSRGFYKNIKQSCQLVQQVGTSILVTQ